MKLETPLVRTLEVENKQGLVPVSALESHRPEFKSWGNLLLARLLLSQPHLPQRGREVISVSGL